MKKKFYYIALALLLLVSKLIALFKADSILRNKYPQFYEKGKD